MLRNPLENRYLWKMQSKKKCEMVVYYDRASKLCRYIILMHYNTFPTCLFTEYSDKLHLALFLAWFLFYQVKTYKIWKVRVLMQIWWLWHCIQHQPCYMHSFLVKKYNIFSKNVFSYFFHIIIFSKILQRPYLKKLQVGDFYGCAWCNKLKR